MAPKAPPAKGKKGTSPGGRACLLVRTVLTAVPAKSSRVSAPTGPLRTRLVHSPTKRAGRWSLPALGKSSPLNQNLARVSFLENARKRNAPARTATEEDQSSSDSSSDDSEVATDSEDRLHSTLDLTANIADSSRADELVSFLKNDTVLRHYQDEASELNNYYSSILQTSKTALGDELCGQILPNMQVRYEQIAAASQATVQACEEVRHKFAHDSKIHQAKAHQLTQKLHTLMQKLHNSNTFVEADVATSRQQLSQNLTTLKRQFEADRAALQHEQQTVMHGKKGAKSKRK